MIDHENDTWHDLVKEATLRCGEKKHLWNSSRLVDSVYGAGCVCTCVIDIRIGGKNLQTPVYRDTCAETHTYTRRGPIKKVFILEKV